VNSGTLSGIFSELADHMTFAGKMCRLNRRMSAKTDVNYCECLWQSNTITHYQTGFRWFPVIEAIKEDVFRRILNMSPCRKRFAECYLSSGAQDFAVSGRSGKKMVLKSMNMSMNDTMRQSHEAACAYFKEAYGYLINGH
jgi:hypothetical protein